jgi:TolA-binding protein
MNTPYELEDLDDYLQGRMSASDKEVFEQALSNDPALQQRLEALRAESSVLEMLRREHLLQQLEQWSEEPSPEKKTDPTQVGQRAMLPRNLVFVLLGILLIIGVAIVWQIFGSKTDQQEGIQTPAPTILDDTLHKPAVQEPIAQEVPAKDDPKTSPAPDNDNAAYALLAANTYMEEDFTQTLMGDGGDDAESRYEQAVGFYSNKQYLKALKVLKNPEKSMEQEYLYLRGYTYYHLGDYQKAEQDFRAFRNFSTSDRKLDAIWCEVFCLVKQLPDARGRLDKVLKEITANPKHPYFDRAQQLQKSLRR